MRKKKKLIQELSEYIVKINAIYINTKIQMYMTVKKWFCVQIQPSVAEKDQLNIVYVEEE